MMCAVAVIARASLDAAHLEREKSPLPQKNAINARRREDFAEHYLRRQRLAEPSDIRIPCLLPRVASHMRAAVFS
jgi:hypothetical protein